MSSLVGHLACGVAVYLAQPAHHRAPRALLPVLVWLAICPDLDYLAFWLWHIDFQPRFSHSIAFAVATSTLAYLALWRWRIPFRVLALAALSHPLLDFLVGVHPVPLWWPFSLPEARSPIGLLPSAGRLSFNNAYLWRNLFIECGILLPVLGVLVARARGCRLRTAPFGVWLVLPLFVGCLLWSLSLHR